VSRLAERIGAPIATHAQSEGLMGASEGCIGVFGNLSKIWALMVD